MTMAGSQISRLAFAVYMLMYGTCSAQVFKATLVPERWIAVQLGESLQLSCSVTDCSTGTPISFVWRSMGDTSLGGKVTQLGSQSNLTISAVGFENAQRIICLAYCGTNQRQMTTDVDVYSFPHDPVISSTPLVAGSPATVTCELAESFPSHRFTLTLMKNTERLEHRTFDDYHDDDEDKRTRILTLEHKFTPSINDEGTGVSCLSEMILDNPDVELEPMKRQSFMALSVSYSPRNVSIALYPSKMLREGDYLNLTCTAESNPPAQITWKKQTGKDVQILWESNTFILDNAELSDSGVYICEAHNSVGRNASTTEINVQAPPTNTSISVLPNDLVKESDSVTISCMSFGVPAPRITLRWKNGSGVTVLVSKEASHTIHHVREEDAGIYECESANELGKQLASMALGVEVAPRSTTAVLPPSEDTPGRDTVTAPSSALKEMTTEDETINTSQSIDITVPGDISIDEGTRYIDIPKEVVNKTQKVEILLSEQEPLKDTIVGIAVLSSIAIVCLLSIVAAIYFTKQAKAQGSYTLVNAKKAIV